MTVLYKMGVMGDLHPVMQKALRKIEHIYRHYYKEDLICTSKREGTHSAGSLHYIGRAADFRYPKTMTDKQELTQRVRASLGPSFDVVPEGNHLHVELDPKPRKRG